LSNQGCSARHEIRAFSFQLCGVEWWAAASARGDQRDSGLADESLAGAEHRIGFQGQRQADRATLSPSSIISLRRGSSPETNDRQGWVREDWAQSGHMLASIRAVLPEENV
jgi:hypothetical protein